MSGPQRQVRSLAKRDRSVAVQDVAGRRLEATSRLRADELVASGKAHWLPGVDNESLRLQLNHVRALAIVSEVDALPIGSKALRRQQRIALLRKRDGDCCFFCLAPMVEAQMTLEHLLARHCNGHNGLSNLVLAHRHCNEQAGHLSMMEKIRIRERALAVRLIADSPKQLNALLEALRLVRPALSQSAECSA